MPSAGQFELVTEWTLEAPLDAVWEAIATPDDWPSWWKAVKRVEPLAPGDASGIGAARRFVWATALPYQLTFDMTVTAVEPKRLLEGRASGELDGVGRWTFRGEGTTTHVRYDWIVAVTKPWMTWLAPVLRPLFAWNHAVVMGWGYDGLRRRLGLPENGQSR